MAGPNQGNFRTMLQHSGLTEVERAELSQKLGRKEKIEGVYTWPAGLLEAYNLAVQEIDQEEQDQAHALGGTQTANVVYTDPPTTPPQDPETPLVPQDPGTLVDPGIPQTPQDPNVPTLPQDPGTPATSGIIYAGDPPAGDPPAGDPPAGDPPAGDPPAGDPPAGDPPAGDPPMDPPSDPPPDDPPADDPAPTEDPPAVEN